MDAVFPSPMLGPFPSVGALGQRKEGKVWIDSGAVEIRISRQDARRIELRIVAEAATRGRPRRVDCWWYVPRQAAGNGRDDLARWIQSGMRTLLRFEAPEWDLADLARGMDPDSPIVVLRALVDEHGRTQDAAGLLRAEEAARLAAAVTIDAIRDANRLLKHHAGAAWRERAERLATMAAAAIVRIRHALDRINPGSAQIRLIDGYLDHEWQILAGKLTHGCPMAERPILASRLETIEGIVGCRRRMDLASLDARAVEEARLRQSVAKKIVFSDLHIEETEAVSSRMAGEIVGSIAAAIAMTFAVAVSYVTTAWWAIGSIPFLMVAVLAYIFKDRIKEAIRRRGAVWIRSVVPDRVAHLRAVKDGRDLGTLREHIETVEARGIPEAIAACRRQGDRHGISLLPFGERVVHHVREWRSPATDPPDVRVAAILRVDLDQIIRRLDDPEARLRLTDDSTRVVGRIYEAYLVVSCADGLGGSALTGVRIVMDGSGIRRVESGELPAAETSEAT